MKIFSFIFKSEIAKIFVLFFVISGSFYANLNNFFFCDDGTWIRRGWFLLYDYSNFTNNPDRTFKPITTIMFFILSHLFELYPFYYYLTLILLHFVNTLLVYYLVKSILGNDENKNIFAFISALIFSVIFGHYQAVIWIGAIFHLVGTTFSLVGILYYIKFLKTKRRKYSFLSYLYFIFASLTNEFTIANLAVLFLVSFLYLKSLKNIIILILPFFILTSIYISFYFLFILTPSTPRIGDLSFGLHIFKNLFSAISEMVSNLLGNTTALPYKELKSDFSSHLYFKIESILQILLVISIFLTATLTFKLTQFSEVKKTFRRYFHYYILFILSFILTYFPFSLFKYLQDQLECLSAMYRYLYFPSAFFSIFSGIIIGTFYLLFKTKKNLFGKAFIVIYISLFLVLNISHNTITIKNGYIPPGDLTKVTVAITYTVFKRENYTTENVFYVNFHPLYISYLKQHIDDFLLLYLRKRIKVHFVERDYILSSNFKGKFKNNIFIESNGENRGYPIIYDNTEYYKKFIR